MDLSFLKQAVPTLVTALGGPFAGLAAGFIADKLGVSDKSISSVTDAIQKASLDPASLVQLKTIDVEFQKYLAGLDIDLEKIAAEDRNSARQREIQVKDNTPRILAYGITIGFFGILSWVMIKGLPAGNEQIATYMLGALGTAWTTIMAYYFGSTKGSADKTASMTSIANNAIKEGSK